jgi:hypothetical protein
MSVLTPTSTDSVGMSVSRCPIEITDNEQRKTQLKAPIRSCLRFLIEQKLHYSLSLCYLRSSQQ